MLKKTRNVLCSAIAASLLGLGAIDLSAQQQRQDGLINVAVGDVTILEDVRIGVGAQVAAQICGLKVGPVSVLGRAVDTTGVSRTVCTSDQGPVVISQN